METQNLENFRRILDLSHFEKFHERSGQLSLDLVTIEGWTLKFLVEVEL